MPVRFYNPGSKVFEKLAFDHPINDVRSMNLISYWQFEAPEKSFFEVPTEIEVNTVNGLQAVSVKFAERVQRDYKDYGIVRIDPKVKEPNPADNVAPSDKEAREKGERLWREFLEAKAREHIANVDQAKAYGVPPKRAFGVYAHALKVLGLHDPADVVGTVVESSRNTAEVKDLEKKVEELTRLIEGLTAPGRGSK